MKSKLLIVACLVIVLSMALILPLSIVNADYSDIQNNPNAVVNFNQYILNTYINNFSITQGTDYDVSNSILSKDHIYYIDVLFIRNSGGIAFECKPSGSNTAFNTFSGVQSGSNYRIHTLYSQSSVDNWRLTLYSNVSGNSIVYAKAIDLTQMFNSGSEPNLSECEALFVSDYYAYNTGSPISLNGLDAYSQGYNDASGDIEIAFTGDILSSTTFTISGTEAVSDSFGNVTFASDGVYGFNFGQTLNASDIITISMPSAIFTYKSSEITSWLVDFGIYDNGGFNVLGSIDISSYIPQGSVTALGTTTNTYKAMEVSITLNQSINAIYFRLRDIGTSLFTMGSAKVVVRTHNVYLALQNAYNSGYSKAYNYYQPGSQGYYDIYQAGYRIGQSEANEYTFGSLMTAVVEAPVNAVLGMFNFDFLGYNFKNVITLIITICVILSIIRLFIGMGASE